MRWRSTSFGAWSLPTKSPSADPVSGRAKASPRLAWASTTTSTARAKGSMGRRFQYSCAE
jgi:hypothetical protein